VALTAAAIAAWLSSGCDRLRPAKEVADSPAAQQPAPPPETVVPESLPATPEGAIAAFEQLPQPMRNDDRLKSLAETPGAVAQITELNLRDSAVTDIGAALLPKFTAVTRLDLTNARISSGALTQIAQMPALTILVIDAVPLGVEPLAELPKLTGLRELSLARTAIEDQAFESLAQIEGLQSLDVSCNERLLGTTFSELVKEGRFAELTSLAASESQFGVAGLKQIGRLKQLQALRLANSGVSDDALQGVANCTELRTLVLGGNPLTGPGLKHLSRLHQLKELKLGGCTPLTDGALNHLRGQKQLERLELDGTTCTPAAVQELKDKFLMGTIVTFGGKEF
jgi:Leucine-rich repeat (LRR) protein